MGYVWHGFCSLLSELVTKEVDMNSETLLRACAWCNHLLDGDNNPVETITVHPSPDVEISHGCCSKCQVGVNAELAEYKARKVGA